MDHKNTYTYAMAETVHEYAKDLVCEKTFQIRFSFLISFNFYVVSILILNYLRG